MENHVQRGTYVWLVYVSATKNDDFSINNYKIGLKNIVLQREIWHKLQNTLLTNPTLISNFVE